MNREGEHISYSRILALVLHQGLLKFPTEDANNTNIKYIYKK